MKIASVDIGTNTVRCLISEVNRGVLKPIVINRDIVRLGENLGSSGRLDPAAVGRLTAVLEAYRDRILREGCPSVRAVGTSALREAGRDGTTVRELSEALGHPIEVISGMEEARLTSLGVQAGIGAVEDGLVLDIGGGSTELIRVADGQNIWWTSLQAGAVHLTEEILRDDPPPGAQVRELRSRFRELLEGEREDGGTLLAGTAGTPTTLAAVQLGIDDYDPTLINGHVLSRDGVENLLEDFLALGSARRLEIKGMEKGREDLIVAGTLMVLEVMERWGFGEMVVSDWGLLEGIAIDLENRK